MNINKLSNSLNLTFAEKVVAAIWLPLSQLTGYESKIQYVALTLLLMVIFYRAVLCPIGSSKLYTERIRNKNRNTAVPLFVWGFFIFVQFIFYYRGLGFAVDLKETLVNMLWLVIIPIYYYKSFLTMTILDADRVLRLTIFGLFIIVLMNIAARIGGIETLSSTYGYVGGNSTMFELFGISARRIIFPFGAGANGYGVVVALALVASLFAFVYYGLVGKLIALMLVICCVYSLAATDSRAALGAGVIVFFISFCWPSLIASKHASLIIFLPIFGPIVLMNIPKLLPNWVIDSLARGSKSKSIEDIVTSGRYDFWNAVISDLSSNPERLFFGYGPYSHAVSAAGAEVGRAFGLTGTNFQFTFHSTAPQLVMDSGIVGVVAFYGLAFWSILALSNAMKFPNVAKLKTAVNGSRLVVSLLCVLLMTGITEATATYYSRDSMIIFLAFCSIALAEYLFWQASSEMNA